MKRLVLALILISSLSGCDTISKLMETDLEGRLGTFQEQLKVFQDAVKAVDEEKKEN